MPVPRPLHHALPAWPTFSGHAAVPLMGENGGVMLRRLHGAAESCDTAADGIQQTTNAAEHDTHGHAADISLRTVAAGTAQRVPGEAAVTAGDSGRVSAAAAALVRKEALRKARSDGGACVRG